MTRAVLTAGAFALFMLGVLLGRFSCPPVPAPPVLILSAPLTPTIDTLAITGGRVQVGDELQLGDERVFVVGLLPRVIRGYHGTQKAAHPRGTVVTIGGQR